MVTKQEIQAALVAKKVEVKVEKQTKKQKKAKKKADKKKKAEKIMEEPCICEDDEACADCPTEEKGE